VLFGKNSQLLPIRNQLYRKIKCELLYKPTRNCSY